MWGDFYDQDDEDLTDEAYTHEFVKSVCFYLFCGLSLALILWLMRV
jgi:hypothetical protein